MTESVVKGHKSCSKNEDLSNEERLRRVFLFFSKITRMRDDLHNVLMGLNRIGAVVMLLKLGCHEPGVTCSK